jgi:hypothetical protein
MMSPCLPGEGLITEIREGFARREVTKPKSECSQDQLRVDPDAATILLEWKRLRAAAFATARPLPLGKRVAMTCSIMSSLPQR